VGRLAIDGCGGWFGLIPNPNEEPANTPLPHRTGKRELGEFRKKALTVPTVLTTFRLPLLQGGAAW
jgi:hypothetical protein